MSKLSIIIPVYNVEDYLAKCLDSAIYPELSGYDIVVVNDGSTDSSGEIAREYAKRYPALIRLVEKENGGLGDARNVGIRSCESDYVMFLDSDDYLSDKAVPEMLQALEGGGDIFIFDCVSETGEGRILSYMSGCDADGQLSLESWPQLLLAPPIACNKLCRRALFTEGGVLFPGRVWFEDIRTMPKLYISAGRIVHVARVWYHYLQRPGSITNSKNAARNLEIIDALEELEGYYRARGLYERYRSEFEYLYFHHVLIASSTRSLLADRKSGAPAILRESFLNKYPGYKANPYVKRISKNHALISALLLRGATDAVYLLMRANNIVKKKRL